MIKVVVEVGSGHSPDPRSHILVDKDLGDDAEREGPLAIDSRPLVIAAGEALPFRCGSATLVVAHQVLEHSDDPVQFLDELHRVGLKVEVDTPSPLQEVLFRDRSFHRWVVHFSAAADEVVYWPITYLGLSGLTGEVFESLYRRQGLVYLLIRGNPGVFLTRWRRSSKPHVREGSHEELEAAIATLLEEACRGSRVRHARALGTAVAAVVKDRASAIRWQLRRVRG